MSSSNNSSDNWSEPIDSIIVVDVQKGFMSPIASEIPNKIKSFLDSTPLAHKIFTRFINPGPDGPFEKILNWNKLKKDSDEIAIVDELINCPTHIIDKYNYSPFPDTDLSDYLRKNNNIEQTYVCGIYTDVCVLIFKSQPTYEYLSPKNPKNN